MTKNIDVSVVVPTMDRGELLTRAIQSVVEQSLQPTEIVVVDNGLKPAIIPENYRTQVKYIRTEPKLGCGKPRNIGVNNSKSEVIAFLDDDDYWDTEYLRHSVSIMPSYDVVVGSLHRRDENGHVRPYRLFAQDKKKQREVFVKNTGFSGQNLMIRRDFFLKIGGFDEDMPATVDRDLGAKAILAGGRIGVARDSIAIECDHGGDRVRSSQLIGNKMFLRKYWRSMTVHELVRSVRRICKLSSDMKKSN